MSPSATPRRRPPRGLVRPVVRLIGRLVLDADLSFERQRARLARIGGSPPPSGVTSSTVDLGGVPALRLEPAGAGRVAGAGGGHQAAGPGGGIEAAGAGGGIEAAGAGGGIEAAGAGGGIEAAGAGDGIDAAGAGGAAQVVGTGDAVEAPRAVLHLHGGGYCLGSSATSAGFAGHLAAAVGVPVVVPEYRLAPETPYPGALEDASTSFKQLAAEYGPDRVVVVGDSAGGGLALALTQRLRAAGEPGPAALGLISPWLDLTVDRASDRRLARRDPMLDAGWLAACASAYAAGTALDDPGVSPLRGGVSGLPPTYVISGADDVLVPDSDRFVLAARDAGVDVAYTRVPGLWHIYPTQAGLLAEADRAVENLAAFLQVGRASGAASRR